MRSPLLLLVPLLACSAGREQPVPPVDSTPSPTTTVAPADTGEAAALAAAGGRASRTGPTLTIRLPGGAPPVVLADDSTEGESYRSFRYHGPLTGTPFHLIRVGYYEGGSWMLIHESTGRQRPLDGRPVVAPGGIRLAAGNFDLEAAFEPNMVEVLRIDGDSLVSEWRVDPADWGPDSLAWVGDTLTLVQQWRETAGQYRPVRVRVARGSSGWSEVGRRVPADSTRH
ncbi:MAG: hypothetical protein JNJ80_03325 [Gemmatimonadetes bacterium]|nr:hypothetical protein [Gemmatimonadota bacterium]